MNKIITYFLFFIVFTSIHAQNGGERIYNFLNIPTSARQAALGGDILTMNDDVNQPLWNPGTINKYIDNKVSVNYVNYLGDINVGSATFAHLINRRFGTLHTGIQYINYGDFIGADAEGVETKEFQVRDLAWSVGYAYQIPKTDFHVGANAKFLSSKIENHSSIGAAFDLGFYYFNDLKPFTFSAVVRNVGYQISPYDDLREDLPFEIAVGASYRLEDVPLKWHLSLTNLQQWEIAYANPSNSETDLEGNTKEEDVNFFDQAIRHVVIGGEFFPERKFNIRFGYNFRRAAELKLTEARTFAGISLGFGLKMGRIKFDYAFTKYHPVSNTSTFSLTYNINKEKI
ncbi:MAG: type IX secretion system protein PorQ [Bacteroidota bacterium]